MASPKRKARFELPDRDALSVCKSPSAAPPRSCYDYNDIVTIRVEHGAQYKDYQAFRGVLRWQSGYFAAALDPDSEFNAGIKLLVIECEFPVFDAFHCWLHTGKLKEPEANAGGESTRTDYFLSSMTMCKIWVFADLRGIPSLSNCVIDSLHELGVATWRSLYRCVPYVYENTTADSKLRTYIKDYYIMVYDLELLQNTNRSLHTIDFLHDVLPAMTIASQTQNFLNRKQMTALDRCRWHDHSGPGGQLRLESRKRRKLND